MLKTLNTLLLLLAISVSVGAQTLYDIISASPNHTTLKAAVDAAGLDAVLDDESIEITLFAPDDDAFGLLPPGTVEELLDDPQGALLQILLYHGVAGIAASTDLSDGDEITTLQGQDVTVSIVGADVFINQAEVTFADINATNGILHVINGVLLPSLNNQTVFDIIAESPVHEILEAAILAAGLDGALSDPNANLTVFAPTDDAFAALPPGLIEELLEDPQGLLAQILLYHVVDGVAFSTDLSDGQLITTLQGQDVLVTINQNGVFINNAQVILADIEGTNGVVHVIDAVLIPDTSSDPSILEIVLNSTDHTILAAAVDAAGLAGALADENASLTLFAPTDAAFLALPPGTIEELLDDPFGLLTQVLLYHVVNGVALSGDLADGQEITTLLGQDIVVTINQNGVFINDAQVTVADIIASNGVVHVIDAVLIPTIVNEPTVYDIIAESPVHTILRQAIDLAGFDGVLSSDELSFTVFAPTDAAFSALPPELIQSLLDDPQGALAKALRYHVVFGTVLSGDLSDGQSVTTALGQDIIVTINQNGIFINDAEVIIADIEASNGVVHVIDAVLLPLLTVYDVIAQSPIHTTLTAAINAAELDEVLQSEGPFTVFAPTDDAFDALPAGVLEELLDDPQGLLTQILLYHVLGEEVLSADLIPGRFTTLLGVDVTISFDNGSVFVNDAEIIVSNIETFNGVVHVIDAILVPVESNTVYDIIANSPDHTTLRAAIDLAGLDEALESDDFEFTVFAPTDAAFDALPPGLLDALLSDPEGALSIALLYHVAFGITLSTDLVDGQSITTVIGQNVEVTINQNGVFINDAQVTVVDLFADNGVVHVIDAVLIPAITVYDVIVNSADHNILEAAINAAGLDEVLSTGGPFTVFAPTDAAFAALPPGTVEALLQDPSGDLTQILLYHVLGDVYNSFDLFFSGGVLQTLQGQDIEIAFDGTDLLINDAKIIVYDIFTFNGVVHVIDAVLLPELLSVRNSVQTIDIKVMPNPTSEKAYISIPEHLIGQDVRAVVTSMTGQIVKSWVLSNTLESVDLTNMPSGTYIFTLTSGNEFGRSLIVRE
jgi:uncharacterized surface protein with fasciclin (FAS1) repeats